MRPTEMRALVDRYIDAYNRMDVDEMLLAVHRDVKFENISGGVVQQSLSLFSERHQRILSFETDGPRAQGRP